jgi:hypothetical protein
MRHILLAALVLAACGGSGSGGGNGDATSGDDGDAMGPRDAGSDGTTSTTDAAIGAACGPVTCKPTEVCCMGAMLACTGVGQCPVPSFACDGPEDCPGAQCCFGSQGQGGSSCKTCAAPACHVDTDCPTTAAKCCPKMFTPGYKVCQTAC